MIIINEAIAIATNQYMLDLFHAVVSKLIFYKFC